MSLSTAQAIVVAGGLVAAAVFFGLRGAGPSATPPVVAAPVVEPPVVVATPAVVVVPRAQVERQASEALAYQRPQILARCYPPGSPPTPAEFLLNVTFDAQGGQLARGIVELPGTSTPALTACVGEALVALRVAPPGANVMVEVPLRLP